MLQPITAREEENLDVKEVNELEGFDVEANADAN